MRLGRGLRACAGEGGDGSIKALKFIVKKLGEYFPLTMRGWVVYLFAMLMACGTSSLLQSAAMTDVYVPLLFVLAVLITAMMTDGYFYGVLASVTSVFAVNWAFTYPYMEVNFSIYGYPLTFLTMLTVSLAVSTLTSRLKEQERIKSEGDREKMRANLLRAVSHDLRTPLTSISGNIGVVLDDGKNLPPEQCIELLTDAKDDAEWLRRMVENLLSITRMTDDHMGTLNMQDEMLEEVISETVVNFKKHFPNVPVSVSVPETLFFVKMDAMLIEQVLLNLMDNAAVHGGKTTKVDIVVTTGGGFARIDVRDDGNGINRKIFDHLFDGTLQFSGMNGSDSTRQMGIGLSVCKTIVKAHGGEISAANRREGGAQFTFTLPLGKEYDYEH